MGGKRRTNAEIIIQRSQSMASFLEKIKTSIGIDTPADATSSVSSEQQDIYITPKEEKPQKIKVEKKPAGPKKVPQLEEEVKAAPKGGEPRPNKFGREEKNNKEKWFEAEGQLAVDVYQTDEELIIQSAIAGVKPEELDITTQGDVVIIKGVREKPAEEENGNYFYQECYWGPFSRQIILPVEADPARSKATIKEGILTIRMPKIEKEKEKKIAVKGR